MRSQLISLLRLEAKLGTKRVSLTRGSAGRVLTARRWQAPLVPTAMPEEGSFGRVNK